MIPLDPIAARLDRIEAKLTQLVEQPERVITPRWLDLQTAAIYSSLSVKSLRRMVSSGRLAARRPVAGKILIDKRELDAAIKAAGDQ